MYYSFHLSNFISTLHTTHIDFHQGYRLACVGKWAHPFLRENED
jgi:hypothetical protein